MINTFRESYFEPQQLADSVSRNAMNKDKWIRALSIIAGALLLAVLSVVGWIAVKVWEMNPTVSDTARRVERIVEVLPDIRVRIAREDLAKQFRAVLLTTEPTEVSKGEWQAWIHYVDFVAGNQKTFVAPLKGPDDQKAALFVTGLATRTARDNLSLADYTIAASLEQRHASVPSYLDHSSSYAIMKSSDKYEQSLRQLLGKPVNRAIVEKGTVNWEQLVDELSRDEGTLRPK